MSPRLAVLAAAAALVVAGLSPAGTAFAGGLTDPFLTRTWKVDGPTPDDFWGSVVEPAGDVNGDGYGDVIVGTADEDTAKVRALLYLGGPSGPALVPAWTYTTSQVAGAVVSSAGDVNADGYSDVVVGLPYWNTVQHMGVGRVAVFHGGPAGLPLLPTYVLNSPEPNTNQQFGYSVDTAGDVNGDGFSDLIVGAPQYSDGTFATRGTAFVFHGGKNGLDAIPDAKLNGLAENGHFGHSVSTAGDMNCDGFDDVIVGAPVSNYNLISLVGVAQVHLGSAGGVNPSTPTTLAGYGPGAQAGTSVSTAGDVNGDGYSDVLVGNPGYQSNSGRVQIVYGSATGPDVFDVVYNAQITPGDYFGHHVATLGDLDGDGYADFGISAANPGGAGRVAVYRGGRTQIGYVGEALPGENGHYAYGLSFATSGDVDGDGFAEILIGDPLAGGVPGEARGRVRMRTLPRSTPRLSANWPRAGAEPGSRYGSALAILPYHDDDDFTRLVIGDPGFNGTGRLSFHLGVAGFGVDVDELPDDFEGTANAQAFGARVVDAGDMDGDSFSDFVVASPGADNGAVFQAGRVDLYRGASTILRPPPLAVLAGGRDFDKVGSALAGRGDVNGDGYHDLLIGAREWDSATTNDVGKAWLYFGGPSGFAAVPWTREGTVFGRGLGAAVALTDLDGDGYTDVIVGSSTPPGATVLDGKVEVHYGGPSGPSTNPGLTLAAPVPSPSFGSVVVALGDVNADGVADLGVGAPFEDAGRGVARVYEGTLGRSQWPLPIKFFTGTQVDGHLGAAMTGGGDMDGDGIGDLAIGEPGWDGGQLDEGRVLIHYGAPFVPEPVPALVFESDLTGAELGASFAPLRDASSDGFADVIAGAPGAAGRVYPLLGGGGAGQRQELRFRDGPPGIQYRFAPAWVDFDQALLAEIFLRSPAGRTRARFEAEIRTQNEPFQRTATHADVANDTQDPFFLSTGFGPLPLGRGYHVRGRVATASPYFPHSRWIASEARASGDLDIHLPGAVVGALPPPPAASDGVPRLASIAPNPARGATASRIELTLPRTAHATLEVFDVRGARVRRLLDATLPAGTATRPWDGRDEHGREVPPGLYFAVLAIEGRIDRARLVRLP